MSTVEERVKKIVIEQLGVKEKEVSNESSLLDVHGTDYLDNDSLDTVKLVISLAEEFECYIHDESE